MPTDQIADAGEVFDPLGDAVEIISDRLYYASFKNHPSTFPKPLSKSSNGKPNRAIHYFCVDNELVYWNFFLDFGPLNLGQLFRFCSKLNYKLHDDIALSQKRICFFSGSDDNKRANAVFLICAYQVLYMKRSPVEALRLLQRQIKSIPPFHDASQGRCTYNLTILDCLKGLIKARQHQFFDFENFPVDEYEYFEQVENGDLNWIAKDKILAFAGPQNRRNMNLDGYYIKTPESYVPYFQRNHIGLVVRLNEKRYDESKFIKAGINHFDCYYHDGSCPSMNILQRILAAFESVPPNKGFAVHCKAGLGRTGTCIGAYLMKHYRFTAAEVIGWMRICRPGMVIGAQQHFLKEVERQMWQEGHLMRQTIEPPLLISENEKEDDKEAQLKHSYTMVSKLQFDSLRVDDQIERICGRPGQADSLLERRLDVRSVNV